MIPAFDADTGLAGLFVSAFLSATVLPGSSEVVLLGVLHRYPDLFWPAVGVATVGNTLGAGTSYVIGRLIPLRSGQRGVRWLQRFGLPALLFTWVPVVGDALPVAAGWLRLHAGAAFALMAAGKAVRYVALAAGWSALRPMLGG